MTSIYLILLLLWTTYGRSFLEPLFWILLICARYGVIYKSKYLNLCEGTSLNCNFRNNFGVYSLFPGNFTYDLKDKYLAKMLMDIHYLNGPIVN